MALNQRIEETACSPRPADISLPTLSTTVHDMRESIRIENTWIPMPSLSLLASSVNTD